MYRQGLGDCFLVTLPRRSGSGPPFHLLIDCGVILGTKEAGDKMTAVAKDIVDATDGRIDLLVATHEHFDHLSGFVQARDIFETLKGSVGEVWLGWTDDPDDPIARELRQEKEKALGALRSGLARLQLAGDGKAAEEVGSILEFFGAAKGASTADALEVVRGLVDKPRYCRPSDRPFEPEGVGARIYPLGPPLEKELLRKINPSTRDKETYGLALGGLGIFLDGGATALAVEDLGRPFDQQFEIPYPYAERMPFFRENYWQSEDDPDSWRRIDTDWLGGISELALQLDSLTNNTSLALAIELADGAVLLFAADAQVGSWLSWQDLAWDVDGKRVTGPDLLARTIVYKVGHHCSHNATLKAKGLEQMKNLRLALVPVDEEMAHKKGWKHIPLPELLAALEDMADGAVLRSDRPVPPIMSNVGETPLYFDVEI